VPKSKVARDGELSAAAKRMLREHRRYRSQAHRPAREALMVVRVDEAGDLLDEVLFARAGRMPSLPGAPSAAELAAALHEVRTRYGRRSDAMWKVDAVRMFGGAPMTAAAAEHVDRLSSWFRGEVDRSVPMSRRQKDAVRRRAEAVLTANLAALHFWALAAINGPCPWFLTAAAAGLQDPPPE
jgi:hypothetical protein